VDSYSIDSAGKKLHTFESTISHISYGHQRILKEIFLKFSPTGKRYE
jgi:hypothetical protein